MDLSRREWYALAAGSGLIMALTINIVPAVNSMTTVHDLSGHVSNTSCGGELACPGSLECHAGFDPDRVGTNISGPRCTTSVYADGYCGVFAATLTMTSEPPRIGGCEQLGLLQIIRNIDPSRIMERLGQPPDGSAILDRYGLISAEKDREQRPEKPQPTCANAGLSISKASYHDDTLTVTITNTGSRPLTITLAASRGDDSLGGTELTDPLPVTETITTDLITDSRPDQVTAASPDCPAVRASTTNITHQ